MLYKCFVFAGLAFTLYARDGISVYSVIVIVFDIFFSRCYNKFDIVNHFEHGFESLKSLYVAFL